MIVPMEFVMKGDFETIGLDFRIISEGFLFSRKCKCTKNTENAKSTNKTQKIHKTHKTHKPVPEKCIEDATCDVLGTEDDCLDGVCYEG
jgi:hypothetical protein